MIRAWTLLFTFSMAPADAFACASCGSGGDDPLILYPNESRKLLLSYGQSFGYQLVDQDGEVGEMLGPDRKQQLLASVGAKLYPGAFATISIPYITNHHESESRSGVGDPLISGRWTVNTQNFANPLVPQIQVLAAHRFKFSKSINESTDRQRLDVFGPGFSQTRFGVDVWSGMSLLMFGFAHVAGISNSVEAQGHIIQPGNESKTTLTAGIDVLSKYKVITGLNRLSTGEITDNGEFVKDSDQLNHSVFASFDVKTDEQGSARFTISKQAAWYRNKNTSSSMAVTIATMRAL